MRLIREWPGKSVEEIMIIEYVLSGVIAILLMIYLFYSLIKPEKF